jgi:hypothetical protein
MAILDSAIYNNGASGGPLGSFGNVLVQSAAGFSVNVSLDNVRLIGGFKPGLRIDGSLGGTSSVTVRNSLAMDNGGTGFGAQTEAPNNGVVTLTVENSTATGNAGFGVHSTGANSTVYISGTTITQNADGVGTTASNLISLGNNSIVGNGANGAPTSTTSLQ